MQKFIAGKAKRNISNKASHDNNHYCGYVRILYFVNLIEIILNISCVNKLHND